MRGVSDERGLMCVHVFTTVTMVVGLCDYIGG